MPSFPFLATLCLASTIASVASCGSSGKGGVSADGGAAGTAVSVVYTVPGSLDELGGTHFLDHPWPSDLRREADGTVRFEGFFDPKSLVLLSEYVRLAKGRFHGFSPVAAGYFRFDGAIDPASLPSSAKDSTSSSSAIQIVDVDPASPEKGKRHFASASFRKEEGVYWLPRTLAVAPALGYPLAPSRRYAFLVTRTLRAEGGGAVGPNASMRQVLGLEAATGPTEAMRASLAGDVATLREAGVAPESIAALTVFTTNDPTAETYRVVDAVPTQIEAPTVRAGTWRAAERTATYDVYEGTYGPSPDYQEGTTPFRTSAEGGGFAFDAAGPPVLQRSFDLRFTLAVPESSRCPPPVDGYPVVLSAHGTTGDYRTAVEGETSVAAIVAPSCLAVMGIDQVLHGTRPGAPPEGSPTRDSDIELLFYNFGNLLAGRTNGRQGAVDVVQQARLFTDSKVTIPADVARGGSPVRFDGSKVLFFGHSQGGLNGALFLAADARARGGVLSGSGSMITTALLAKTKPEPSVASALRLLLQLTSKGDAAGLDTFPIRC
ncbi:MAG: hypothetical protein U0169_02830 [Polyangiaceae bacterium]